MNIRQLDLKEMDLDRIDKLIAEDTSWWGYGRTRPGTFPVELDAGEYWVVAGGEGRLLKPVEHELKAGTWIIAEKDCRLTVEIRRELVTTSGHPTRALRRRFATFLRKLPAGPRGPKGCFERIALNPELEFEAPCLVVCLEPGPLCRQLSHLNVPYEIYDLDHSARTGLGSPSCANRMWAEALMALPLPAREVILVRTNDQTWMWRPGKGDTLEQGLEHVGIKRVSGPAVPPAACAALGQVVAHWREFGYWSPYDHNLALFIDGLGKQVTFPEGFVRQYQLALASDHCPGWAGPKLYVNWPGEADLVYIFSTGHIFEEWTIPRSADGTWDFAAAVMTNMGH